MKLQDNFVPGTKYISRLFLFSQEKKKKAQHQKSHKSFPPNFCVDMADKNATDILQRSFTDTKRLDDYAREIKFITSRHMVKQLMLLIAVDGMPRGSRGVEQTAGNMQCVKTKGSHQTSASRAENREYTTTLAKQKNRSATNRCRLQSLGWRIQETPWNIFFLLTRQFYTLPFSRRCSL